MVRMVQTSRDVSNVKSGRSVRKTSTNLDIAAQKTNRVASRTLSRIEELQVQDDEEQVRPPSLPSVYLPDEIILHILDYIRPCARSQHSLWACALVSRQWFETTVPYLYQCPRLGGNNFDPFVRAICPSINLHVRKSPLAELVKELDMSRLVYQASKSMTARILGRTKDSLEVFVAPQASFAINCFPALAKCKSLSRLDLSLVTELGSLQTLFNTVKGLPRLTELRLPRSSGFGTKVEPHDIEWPPSLKKLFLSGSIDAHFLYGVVHLPQTLRELTIEHCPLAKGHALRSFLHNISREGIRLEYLKLSHMPRLSGTALDGTLALLPGLRTLSVSVDYVSSNLIDTEFNDVFPSAFELRNLELTTSGNPGIEEKLSPLDVIIAVDGGALPFLRRVLVSKTLGWRHPTTVEDFDALDDTLKEASSQDDGDCADHGLMLPVAPGVWEFS